MRIVHIIDTRVSRMKEALIGAVNIVPALTADTTIALWLFVNLFTDTIQYAEAGLKDDEIHKGVTHRVVCATANTQLKVDERTTFINTCVEIAISFRDDYGGVLER